MGEADGAMEPSSVVDAKRVGKKGHELWLLRVPADIKMEDLKKLEISVSGSQAGAPAYVEEVPAGSLESSAAHGQRQWDVHVVPAAKAEASQIWGLFPQGEHRRLVIQKPFDRQVNFVERVEAPKIDRTRWKRNPPVPQISSMPGKISTSGHGLAGLPPDDGEDLGTRKGKKKKRRSEGDEGGRDDKKDKKQRSEGDEGGRDDKKEKKDKKKKKKDSD